MKSCAGKGTLLQQILCGVCFQSCQNGLSDEAGRKGLILFGVFVVLLSQRESLRRKSFFIHVGSISFGFNIDAWGFGEKLFNWFFSQSELCYFCLNWASGCGV